MDFFAAATAAALALKWNVYKLVLLWFVIVFPLYLDLFWKPCVDPSSLDRELVFSKSIDIFLDSFSSTDPL